MADRTQWTRKPRSNSNWHHLSAPDFDDGKRWSIIWDIARKPGVEGRNTAIEKFETGALDRARHMLRMGFIVYEIRDPLGSVYLEEAGLRYVWVAPGQDPPQLPRGFRVLKRRWVVERTFAWLGRNRRLSNDYEALPASEEAWIYAASSRLLLRRLVA